MSLNLNSLEKAVRSLEKAINVAHKSFRGQVITDEQAVIRAGVIQNFEFTYELCWKFMKRWLEINLGSSSVDGLPRKELFRIAAENHLITEVETWFFYHNARNETSYAYDENKAEDVFNAAVKFVKDAKGLLEVLEKKND